MQQRLEACLEEAAARARGEGRDTAAMVEQLQSLTLRAGKRTRPALALTGLRAAAPSAPLELLLPAASALELLQSYLLIHDDWMDEDAERRGGPAVHVALSRHFRSTHLGACSAILAGDFGVALAQAELMRCPVSPARRVQAMQCFAEMQQTVVLGQQLDLAARGAPPERVYELKTSSYSVWGPLELGALLGGAKPALLQPLERWALPIGVAFQLRDDLLGTFGDSEVTGKPVGNDLLQGKRTALSVLARSTLRGAAAQALQAVLGKGKAPTAAVRRAQRALRDAGLEQRMEARIEALASEARQHLNAPALPEATRRVLLDAEALLLTRTH